MLQEVKQCFQSDVQLLSVRFATSKLLAVLNSKYSVNHISWINGEMVLFHEIKVFTKGDYAQLHARTADCCFDHSHHAMMIYGRQQIWVLSTVLLFSTQLHWTNTQAL
jgi:hypothetical protein